LEVAREKAYGCVSRINFENMYYRKDIGQGVSNID
jgi:phosphoribosylamine-glycine ligase